MIRHMLSDHRPHWWAEIDEYDLPSGKFLLAHVKFANFCSRTYRQFLKEWRQAIPALKVPLFAYNMENGGDTWCHFVERLGFKRTCQLAPNGEPFFVFIPDFSNDHVNTEHNWLVD